jgi:hypothetical protein
LILTTQAKIISVSHATITAPAIEAAEIDFSKPYQTSNDRNVIQCLLDQR